MTEKTKLPETAEKPAKATAPKAKTKRRKSKSKKAPDGRGRPKWVPSIDERIAVEQMKFCGEPEAVIARSLKVDVKTLRLHCAYELDNGHANRRRQVIGQLFKAADEGNVSAIKRLDEMGKIAGAAAALEERSKGEQVGAPIPASAPQPEKIGKKEERQAAAEKVAASGKFQPPAAPKLVVNNAVNE